MALDDEFGWLHENAAELGLAWEGAPVHPPARLRVDAGGGQYVSVLRWGTTEPELVFLHGGGQNAHTWDSTILALGRPAIAVDLPGHGHSDRRADRNYGPWRNADALEAVLPQLAPAAQAVVGMSLGGATTTRLAAVRPDLCPRAVVIDVTPQINDPNRTFTAAERGSVALIGGPPTYESLEAMIEATAALTPNRPRSAVARGVRHNACPLDDGTWTWRYDLFGGRTADGQPQENWVDFTPLWDDVSRIAVPTMFVRGADSFFVTDEDVDQWLRRLPSTRLEVVEGSGHAVQSDQPLVLAELIETFVFGPPS